MVLTVTAANDWKQIPKRESILYFVRLTEGTFSNAYQVNNAKRMALDKTTIGGNKDLLERGISWTVWRNQLQAAGIQTEPKFADKIQDSDGIKYEILHVDVLSIRERFRLTCVWEVGQAPTPLKIYDA